jgi:hypothetical protein
MNKQSCILVLMFLFISGCEQSSSKKETDAARQLAPYGAKTLSIIALSELTPVGDEGNAKLKLFVMVLDDFGCAVKVPGVFRIEIYENIERSPSPIGRRLEMWPDINLVDPCKNNGQWRDYLRAYEFILDVNYKLERGRVYIAEVTCQLPTGKRMTAKQNIKF